MIISIHALREEGDVKPEASAYPGSAFLSTPSARRATCDALEGLEGDLISIHALREEGDLLDAESHPHGHISIHALREEGDDDVGLSRRAQ